MNPLVVDPCGYLKPHHSVGHCRSEIWERSCPRHIEMADSRCFVRFPHPGGEHRPGPGGHAAWKTLRAAHARKFMQMRGEWIEADGSIRRGDLWTWGESEAQSQRLRRLGGPIALGYPRNLWRPYYVIPDAGYVGLHNTDPFIFGERFLHSNCKQLSGKRIRSLARGSVIAFGTQKAGQWVLDTVLLVSDLRRLHRGAGTLGSGGLCARSVPGRDRRAASRQRRGCKMRARTRQPNWLRWRDAS